MNESTARHRHLAEHGTEPEWARVGFKHKPPEVVGVLHGFEKSDIVSRLMSAKRVNVPLLQRLAVSSPPIVSRRQRRANWRESRDTTHTPAIAFTGSHRERAQAHRANWSQVVEHGRRYTDARNRAFLQILGGSE